jgi:hypothetical protein
MRVRPQRIPGRGREQRRPHILGRSAPAAPDPATPEPADGDPAADHPAERRHRESVAPEDHALYRCVCGFVFEADVSATVSCPHCGAAQAW